MRNNLQAVDAKAGHSAHFLCTNRIEITIVNRSEEDDKNMLAEKKVFSVTMSSYIYYLAYIIQQKRMELILRLTEWLNR